MSNVFNLAYEYLGITKKDFSRFQLDILPVSMDKLEKNRFKFIEIGPGLSQNVINFYINNLKKAKISKSEYVSRKIYKNIIQPINCFCYSEKCIPTMENSIKSLDFFRSIVIASQNSKNKIEKIQKHKKLDRLARNDILNSSIRRSLKERNVLWEEIENGLSRLLKNEKNNNPKKLTNCNLSNNEMILLDIGLMLHGHQFKKWIKSNNYWFWQEKPKNIVIGHYHVMLPMIRYNSLIIFNGHLKNLYRNKFSKYYLSHMGQCAIMKKEKSIIKVFFHRLA